MIDASRIWTPRADQGHTTPFQAGAGRALVQAFPLVVDDVLPKRMEEALQALSDLDPVVQRDQGRGSAR